MVAGVELEQHATGYEMSNQQSEKQSFPNTNLDRLRKTGGYLQLRSFTVFVGLFETLLACSSPKVVIFVELPLLWGFCWHLAFTTSTVATLRMARLGWFPRQAKLPLHGVWHRTGKARHWP